MSGIAPHRVVFAAKTSESVLSHAAADSRFAGVDIAFGQPDVAAVLQSEQLRWIQLTSAGYTRYDTAEFRAAVKARDVVVTNSSGVYAAPCAEHILAFMLAQSRRLPLALSTRCANGSPEWTGIRYTAASLHNQKVVLLGFGAIAARLLELLRPFQMQIVAFRRRARSDEGVPVVALEGLGKALGEADHVINILPDNAETIGFVSAERLAQMKPGAIFYNIGRGTTVDQSALVTALDSGRLGAAWLDVTDPEPLPDGHPLLSAPNCFITPHTGGGHCNESESLVRHFLENFRRFQDGSPLCDRIM